MQDKKDIFNQALNENRKILLTDFNEEHNLYQTRLCIPLEHIPPISESGFDYFYFWNPEAEVGERIFGLPPTEIQSMVLSDESFNPNNYIIPNTRA